MRLADLWQRRPGQSELGGAVVTLVRDQGRSLWLLRPPRGERAL